MPSKLIFCQPETLVIAASNCNKQIDIAEVMVCDAMIGAEYNLRINGVIDAGSPFVVDANGKLFLGDLTITRTVPITSVTLEFQCDDCDTCDITATLPPIANPCACAATTMTVAIDVTNACVPGDIDYTITDGEGPYQIVIKNGATTVYSDTQAVAGTYTASGTFTNGLYTLTVTDVYGCVRTDSATVTACCELSLVSVSYDCDNEEVVSTHFATCVGAKSYRIKQGVTTISSSTYTGADIPISLPNGTYTFEIWCDTCVAGPVTFVVGCGTPTFSLSQGCSGTDNTITVSNFAGGTAPYTVNYRLGTGSTTSIGSAVDPTVINLGSVVGQTVYVTITNSEGNTSVPEQSLVIQSCNCFTITGATYECDPDTQDKTIKVKVSSSSTYVVDLLDSGNNVITSNIYTGSLNSSYTNVFGPDALDAGTYRVKVRDSGNNCEVISSNIVIADCNEYFASYDCETGLDITGLAGGQLFYVVKGATTYGPYDDTNLATDLFFVDGTNYGVKIDGVIVTTFNVSCCTFTLTVEPQACNLAADTGEKAALKIQTANGAVSDTYSIEIYLSGGAFIGSGGISGNASLTVTGLPENVSMDVYVHNDTYEGRAYINAGPPNSPDCIRSEQNLMVTCAELNCAMINSNMTVAIDSCANPGDVTLSINSATVGIVPTSAVATYYRTTSCGSGSKVVNYTSSAFTTIDANNFELLLSIGDDIEHCCDCFFYVKVDVNYTYGALSCTKSTNFGSEGSSELCDSLSFQTCIETGVLPGCNF